jgi:hypothetical protein
LIYRYLWVGTEVWLTLGQIMRDENRIEDAGKAARRAHALFTGLVAFGKAHLASPAPAALKDLERRVATAAGRSAPVDS